MATSSRQLHAPPSTAGNVAVPASVGPHVRAMDAKQRPDGGSASGARSTRMRAARRHAGGLVPDHLPPANLVQRAPKDSSHELTTSTSSTSTSTTTSTAAWGCYPGGGRAAAARDSTVRAVVLPVAPTMMPVTTGVVAVMPSRDRPPAARRQALGGHTSSRAVAGLVHVMLS